MSARSKNVLEKQKTLQLTAKQQRWLLKKLKVLEVEKHCLIQKKISEKLLELLEEFKK